jgi:hypothetical protein
MAPKGERNPMWKENPGYTSLHRWMATNFPLAGTCEHCGDSDKPTEYASVGHVYTRLREDWLELCRSCHRRMDGPYERTPEIRAATGERSRGRTLSPASRRKVSESKTDHALHERIRARRAAGESYSQIREAEGCAETTITRAIRGFAR